MAAIRSTVRQWLVLGELYGRERDRERKREREREKGGGELTQEQKPIKFDATTIEGFTNDECVKDA